MTTFNSDNFLIRPITPSDIGDYYDIRFSVDENRIHPHQIHLLHRNVVLENITSSGGAICIERHSGVAVGAMMVLLTAKPMISALFVRPGYHGLGIGKALLDQAIALCRQAGVEWLTLVTDPGSRADGFYQRQGWTRGGLDEYGTQVIFTKRLTDAANA
jgi:GNAT superfamily N-acetyltransferase